MLHPGMFLLACYASESKVESTSESHSDSMSESVPAEEPYNLVMISIDTLRRKAVGRYNGGAGYSQH